MRKGRLLQVLKLVKNRYVTNNCPDKGKQLPATIQILEGRKMHLLPFILIKPIM
jgi:hypothetical protein